MARKNKQAVYVLTSWIFNPRQQLLFMEGPGVRFMKVYKNKLAAMTSIPGIDWRSSPDGKVHIGFQEQERLSFSLVEKELL